MGVLMSEWQPIETAPKDGTEIDLWHEEFGRYSDCHWGLPEHCCGEYGRYCDSDWHAMKEGWIMSILNELLDADSFTHWMPLPAPPITNPHASESSQDGS